MRGGVPVLNRRVSRPAASSCSPRCALAASPARPPAICVFVPMCSFPRPNVPVVSTTARASKASAFECFESSDAPTIVVEQEPSDGALDGMNACVLFQQRAHGAPIQSAVALRARRPDRRSLALIEHAELEHGQVRGAGHDAAERVHLAHHRALGHAANGRIARHLPDGLERTRDEPDGGTRASCSDGRFGACVAAAYNQDIECGFSRPGTGHA